MPSYSFFGQEKNRSHLTNEAIVPSAVEQIVVIDAPPSDIGGSVGGLAASHAAMSQMRHLFATGRAVGPFAQPSCPVHRMFTQVPEFPPDHAIASSNSPIAPSDPGMLSAISFATSLNLAAFGNQNPGPFLGSQYSSKP